jgi:hypothetical protein
MSAETRKSKRGGPRPGSGRPKGTKNPLTKQKEALQQEVIARAIRNDVTPLEVMLNIMRDPETDASMRFEAAKAAAPYVHPRLSQVDSTVTHKRDVAELTTAELDELLAAELASGKARTARGQRDPDSVH